MASSAAVNDQYRATLEHCYRDLYWCWENAGLGGDLMLELTSNWEALTEPLRARWEQTITGLVETWQQLQGEWGGWCCLPGIWEVNTCRALQCLVLVWMLQHMLSNRFCFERIRWLRCGVHHESLTASCITYT
jgi:hypothetical protein